MRFIIIPLFIIAVLAGIYYAGDIWKGVNLSLPGSEEGEGGFNIRKFLP